MNQTLIYLGSAFVSIWGIAHLFPTKSIIKGFGDITTDNKRIVAMEWIIEGAALIFIGAIVSAAAYLDYSSAVSRAIYGLSFIMLNTLALISLFTGFRISFLPFKLCPVIFFTASVLILAGGYL